MGKYLPFIVPVLAALFVLIFGYLYIQAGKSVAPSVKTFPVEVPKDLPTPFPLPSFSSSPSPAAQSADQTQTPPLMESRLKALEASNLELKSRIAALEKPSATPSSVKPPLYIPLGTGSVSGDQNWASIATYQVDLNPSDYPGITNAVLEVNMRLNQASGTGYARLYNSTDNAAVSSEVSTTSDSFGWFSSSTFHLTSGKKTYKLQLKSSTGTEIAVQSARIKINFQ